MPGWLTFVLGLLLTGVLLTAWFVWITNRKD